MNIKEMPLKQRNGFRHDDQLCLLQLQKKAPQGGLWSPRDPEAHCVFLSRETGLEQQLLRALGHGDVPFWEEWRSVSPSLGSPLVTTRVERRLLCC